MWSGSIHFCKSASRKIGKDLNRTLWICRKSIDQLKGNIFLHLLASWRQMALEHFKPTRMHLWQVGCTGNLMTDHVIPWNGGLVLFSAAGLLPLLLNLARQFASLTSPSCLLFPLVVKAPCLLGSITIGPCTLGSIIIGPCTHGSIIIGPCSNLRFSDESSLISFFYPSWTLSLYWARIWGS